MTTHTYDIRCYEAGSTCPFHGRRVRDTSARGALSQVVNSNMFGPLHRRSKDNPERIAYVNIAHAAWQKLSMDVRHGALYVRQIGETR